MRIKAVLDIGKFSHGFQLPAGQEAEIEDSLAQGAVESGAAMKLDDSNPPTPPPAAGPPPAKPAEGTEGETVDTPKPTRRRKRRDSSEEKPDELHS